ncbi:hypothetical protein Emed_007523 [Eimeria media]
MLSVLKNALVTGVSKEDGGIRKKELDWFSSNCWIVASQAAVIAGFTFSQLSKQPELDTDNAGAWFHLFHAAFTGLGFVCALSVLVRATFSGIYAQGLALRGHAGFSDMAAAVRRLRADQDRILGQFMLSLACFLLSSFAAVFLASRKGKASVKVEAALLFVSLAVAAVAWRAINLFSHGSAAVGGVSGIEGVYSRVGDLDALVAQGRVWFVSEGAGEAYSPDHTEGPTLRSCFPPLLLYEERLSY